MAYRRMWEGIVVVLVILVGAYAGFAALLYLYQSSFIYYPDRQWATTPQQLGLRYESVTFKTTDGLMLSGWYVPADETRGVLLFFHGNAGNISHRMLSIQVFNRLRLDTFIIDYRGYGKSEGQPDEVGTYLDAEAAWYYLVKQRNVDPSTIVVFGRSLGAAIASHLAVEHTPRALIVESAFTSVPDLAAKFYPFMPVRWLTRFRYATKDHLPKVTCPVLVVHSRDDDIVPFGHGQALFQAARPPKDFLGMNGSHNDALLVTGRRYEQGLDRFLVKMAGL